MTMNAIRKVPNQPYRMVIYAREGYLYIDVQKKKYLFKLFPYYSIVEELSIIARIHKDERCKETTIEDKVFGRTLLYIYSETDPFDLKSFISKFQVELEEKLSTVYYQTNKNL